MMIGSVVGVGVFGIPYAFAQSGFVIGLLELIVLAVLICVMQFMFAEIVLQTSGKHRLVGYVEQYLGHRWRWLATAAVTGSYWGSSIAYMIVGGKLLSLLFPVNPSVYFIFPYIVAGIAGLLMYRGVQFASKIEIGVIFALLFLFLFTILRTFFSLHTENFLSVHLENAFLPYGVLLFALSSVGIVPEMRVVLGSRAKSEWGKSVLIGMIVIAVWYACFAFAVVGVTGASTTQAAFDGLVPFFGSSFKIIATVLGSISIFSIFMLLGTELMNTFQFDFKTSKNVSWLLTVGVPVCAYAFGVHEFTNVIEFVGAVFGGLLGMMIVLTYLRMKSLPFCKKQQCLRLPNVLSFLILAVFFGGIGFELLHFLI